jgi:hypothetical protein
MTLSLHCVVQRNEGEEKSEIERERVGKGEKEKGRRKRRDREGEEASVMNVGLVSAAHTKFLGRESSLPQFSLVREWTL